MIINRDDYKLNVTITILPQRQYHVVIERWIPEGGWRKTELFLEQDEFNKLKSTFNQY